MNDSDYVVWDTALIKNVCMLTKLDGIDQMYRLDDGESLVEEIESMRIHMNPDHPRDTLLADVLPNPYSQIIASESVVTVMRSRAIPSVEYLPITIVDHKGHDVAQNYYIVHPIDHIDCLDIEGSGAEWDMVDEETIDSVERIVLRHERLDKRREVFRPKPYLEVVIITRNLADALDEAGVKGCEWVDLSDYSGF